MVRAILVPAITANISVFYLLFFLTDVAGLSAGLAGSVLMVVRIFDAINDPIIGTVERSNSYYLGSSLTMDVIGVDSLWN
jgi:Na+/melibiose symporter-like transporter